MFQVTYDVVALGSVIAGAAAAGGQARDAEAWEIDCLHFF